MSRSAESVVVSVRRANGIRKEDFIFFLDENNKIAYNRLCVNCRSRSCRQSHRVIVVFCRKCRRKA